MRPDPVESPTKDQPGHVADDGRRRLAIIGTAGRAQTAPPGALTTRLWEAMLADVRSRVRQDDILISGGAAWADHLAVHAFLQGWVSGLELYLPAPMREDRNGNEPSFAGPWKSSGDAANYYHGRFRAATGVRSLWDLLRVYRISTQPLAHVKWFAQAVAPGYAAMHVRNGKIAARCTEMVAYTFGPHDEPVDGGTAQTWRLAPHAKRVHVPLGLLASAIEL